MRFSHFITACALTFIGAQAMAFNAVEGKDYRVVSPSVSSASDSIEVIDFFAYTCAHCQRLATLL